MQLGVCYPSAAAWRDPLGCEGAWKRKPALLGSIRLGMQGPRRWSIASAVRPLAAGRFLVARARPTGAACLLRTACFRPSLQPVSCLRKPWGRRPQGAGGKAPRRRFASPCNSGPAVSPGGGTDRARHWPLPARPLPNPGPRPETDPRRLRPGPRPAAVSPLIPYRASCRNSRNSASLAAFNSRAASLSVRAYASRSRVSKLTPARSRLAASGSPFSFS